MILNSITGFYMQDSMCGQIALMNYMRLKYPNESVLDKDSKIFDAMVEYNRICEELEDTDFSYKGRLSTHGLALLTKRLTGKNVAVYYKRDSDIEIGMLTGCNNLIGKLKSKWLLSVTKKKFRDIGNAVIGAKDFKSEFGHTYTITPEYEIIDPATGDISEHFELEDLDCVICLI